MAITGSVTADVETADANRIGVTYDIVDDPAILIHPTTPSSSVVVTTNKDLDTGGIYVYDLNGVLVESEGVGQSYNNVDLRYNFGGYDNVIGGTNKETGDLHFWTYDYGDTADEMREIGRVDTGYSTANRPYGFAMGRLGDTHYAFSTDEYGTQVKQWELTATNGVISGALVRTIDVNGQVEGMVTDDVNGVVYLAEEEGAIKKFSTDPGSGVGYEVVDQVGAGGNLVEDIEGLAIYYGSDPGQGYLIASSQGESKYAVYNRTGGNDYLGEFAMAGNSSGIDGVTATDGLDVTSANLGGEFASGLFVVHDHLNTGDDDANFKMVSWDEIANLGGLITDTTFNPRDPVTGSPPPPPPPPPTTPPPPAYFTLNTTDGSTKTLTGTSRNDTLTGTAAPEKFNGLAGADSYNGGAGDDQFVIENTGDRIASDTSGQDTEEIWGSFNWTLSATSEHAIAQGSTTRTITGNASDNILTAAGSGAGVMTLRGLAGDDNIRVSSRDVVATGGADNDIFRYTASAVGDGNTVTDFTWGEDLLDLSAAVASSTAPTVNPFSNGVLALVNSGANVKVMYDQDGSAGSIHALTEIVELIGVQVGAGVNQAHIYTGL